jgi:hypothetical protein
MRPGNEAHFPYRLWAAGEEVSWRDDLGTLRFPLTNNLFSVYPQFTRRPIQWLRSNFPFSVVETWI